MLSSHDMSFTELVLEEGSWCYLYNVHVFARRFQLLVTLMHGSVDMLLGPEPPAFSKLHSELHTVWHDAWMIGYYYALGATIFTASMFLQKEMSTMLT